MGRTGFAERGRHKRTILGIVCVLASLAGSGAGASARVVHEKDLNLDIAGRIAAELGAAGTQVVQTRTGDSTVALPDRAAFARRSQADLTVSLHNNASSNRSADWAEVYRQITSRSSLSLAESISSAFGEMFGPPAHIRARRGSHGDYYHQLRTSRIPAVIVESAFVSNPAQARRLATSPEYRQQIAVAVAGGILAYQRSLGAPPPTPDPGPTLRSPASPVPRGFSPVPGAGGVGGAATGRFSVSLNWTGSPGSEAFRIYRDGRLLAQIPNPAWSPLPDAASLTGADAGRPFRFRDRWAAPGQRYHYEIAGIRMVNGITAESQPAPIEISTPSLRVCLDPGHGGADPGATGTW